MNRLLVATWNVLYRDLDARTPLLVDRIRRISPDVLLLQETNPDHAERLAAETGMRLAVAAPAREDGLAVLPAILTRDEPLSSGARLLPLDSGAWRHYLYTEVDVAGTRVRCATAHLQHTVRAGRMGIDADFAAASRGERTVSEIADAGIRESVAARLTELEAIADEREQLAPVAEVFGGDLNFVPHGVEHRRIIDWGMTDAWLSGPRLGSGATILGANPLIADGPHAYDGEIAELLPGHDGLIDYTLDYQFHSAGLRAGRAWTFGAGRSAQDWPSDHLGLAVEYSLCGRA